MLEFENLLLAVTSGVSINNLITVRTRRDGTPIDVAVTASPLFDARGTVVGVAEIAGDVTELISARDALALSEERFRSLVQHGADAALVFDAEGDITYASPAVEVFGYAPEDLVGKPIRFLAHPDDVEAHRQSVIDSIEMNGSTSVEWRIRTADGSYRWAEEVITDVRDVPAVGGHVANIRDITDRKHAEVRRLEAEERFRQGFECSAFGLAILDLDYTCTSANPALSELLRYPVERLLGRRPLEFLHPAETNRAAKASNGCCAPTGRTSTSANTAWCAATARSSGCWST